MKLSREELLKQLALLIQAEATGEDAEPYRNAGDRLVDEALQHID